MYTPVKRLLMAMKRQPVDRPPVVCPGGMMTLATCSAMRSSGASLPGAHSSGEAMARLATATTEQTGFECLSVPYCMTVEAEALGCTIDLGTDIVLPHVSRPAIENIDGIARLPRFDPHHSGRAPVVLDAIKRLRKTSIPCPIIGAVVGPVSLANTVMETGTVLRLMRRNPDSARLLIEAMENVVVAFAQAQHAAGADCIMIAEPTATGEIIGGAHFGCFAVPSLSRILRALDDNGIPAILHICGDISTIVPQLRELARVTRSGLTLSVDHMVSGRLLARDLPGVARAGNVSAELLKGGSHTAIVEATKRAVADFMIVSPACGLLPDTPPANLRVFTETVRSAKLR